MIWLVGHRGMLGQEVEKQLKIEGLPYFTSDIEHDITKREELEEFIKDKKFDWIINCSAYTAVDKAENEKELAFNINSKGPANLAIIANKKNAKIIHISTDYVFNGRKASLYKEEDKTDPLGVYGQSKLEGERSLINLCKKYFILRISWLFGLHGNNFIKTMINLFMTKDEVSVVNDQKGFPTYAVDLARIIVTIIKRKANQYGIYHVTNSGEIISWYQFAVEIYRLAYENHLLDREVTIIPIETVEYITKARRPKNSGLSKEKLRCALGLSMRSWKDALKEFIEKELKYSF
jgi:dTDP-4-dehydrorhamnose reductase